MTKFLGLCVGLGIVASSAFAGTAKVAKSPEQYLHQAKKNLTYKLSEGSSYECPERVEVSQGAFQLEISTFIDRSSPYYIEYRANQIGTKVPFNKGMIFASEEPSSTDTQTGIGYAENCKFANDDVITKETPMINWSSDFKQFAVLTLKQKYCSGMFWVKTLEYSASLSCTYHQED